MRDDIETYGVIIGFIAVIIFAVTRTNIDINSLFIGMALIGLPLRLFIFYKNTVFASRIAWEMHHRKAKFEQREKEKADDYFGTKANTYPMENEDFLIPDRGGVYFAKKHDLYFYGNLGLYYSKDSINFYGKALPPSKPFNLKGYLPSAWFVTKLNREGWFKKQIEEDKEFNKKYGEKDE
jgi:hypothetical protein